jgi:transposase
VTTIQEVVYHMKQVDYREVLRLKHLNYSQNKISAIVRSSHHTIKAILDAAHEKQISWPIDPDVTNQELELLLFPDKYKAVSMYVEPDYAYIHRELAKRGVTMTLLWEEYCQQFHESGRTPYQSTQFGEKYRRWARVTKATMRIQHKPGDAMEVDWAGDTIPVFDPVTGEESAAYLFVAVLPCSGYIYAEACDDMKTENWLLCHVHAYNYFDGVTRLLIPDNLKTGVISNTRYDVVLNRSYQELAEHYGTAIVPTRVRKPRDKSHAESSVRFAETWIIAALRDYKFFSVQDLNRAAAQKRGFRHNRGCDVAKAALRF